MEINDDRTCAEGIRRKQGGQPGNQNARKHGFYSKVLDAEERRDYEEAKNCVGLEDEIALLRAKIASVLRHDGQNLRLLFIAMATMCRLIATQRHMVTNDAAGIKEGVRKALDGLPLPREVTEVMLAK